MVFGPRVPLRSTHGLRSYAASRLNGSNAQRNSGAPSRRSARCGRSRFAPSNHGRDGTTRIAPAGSPLVAEKPRYPDAPIRPPHIALRGDGQAGLLLPPSGACPGWFSDPGFRFAPPMGYDPTPLRGLTAQPLNGAPSRRSARCGRSRFAPSNHGRDGTTLIAPAGSPLVAEKPRYPDAPIRPPHIALRGDGQAGLLLRPVRGLPWMVFGPRVPLRSTHGLRSYAASRLNRSTAQRNSGSTAQRKSRLC